MPAASKRDRTEKAAGAPKGIGGAAAKGNKRPKALPTPIRKDLLTDKVTTKLRAQHDNSGPYRHVVIDNLCEPERMRAVHEEAINTMKTTFKETDLFKVYQTGDLANLDLDSQKAQAFPELLALRSSLYSPEFRAFVSKITGVDDLTDRTDCSGNAYTQGCHLLCHDDVIGTRRVSYIIYMTDPDEEWKETDGGSLELYPLDADHKTITKSPVLNNSSMTEIEQGVPALVPTHLITPRFNRMAIFTVQPGRSYHSVQEVYAPHKVRLSISGWYHGPCPPLGADQASLAQVMSKGAPEAPHTPFPNLTNKYYLKEKEKEKEREKRVAAAAEAEAQRARQKKEAQLKASAKEKAKTKAKTIAPAAATDIGEAEAEADPCSIREDDRQYLAKYINAMYLRPAEMRKIRDQFVENSAVQLTDFLDAAVVASVAECTQRADSEQGFGAQQVPRGYTVGVGGPWKHVGPPHKRNHLSYVSPSADVSKGSDAGKKKTNGKGKAGSAPAAPAAAASDQRAGAALDEFRQQLFSNEAFARYLTCLTTLKPTGSKSDVRRFRAGLDYTVAHFGAMTEIPRLDATLCFASDDARLAAQEAREAAQVDKMNADDYSGEGEEEEEAEVAQVPDWESGDCGGYEVYISADTDENGETAEAAEVYKTDSYGVGETTPGAEDDSTLLSVSPGFNVLSLVMRDRGIMRFVKYVNSTAPGSRWDITTEYEIVQESDSDSDSDDEEEEGADE